MSFLEEASAHLYYRRAPGAPIEVTGPAASDAIHLSLERSAQRVKGSLRGKEVGVYLERLVLEKADPAGIVFTAMLPAHQPYHLFKHGYQSWSYSSFYGPGELDLATWLPWKRRMDENPEASSEALRASWPAWLQRWSQRGKFQSDGLVGLADSSGERALLLAVSGPGNQLVRFYVKLHPRHGFVQACRIIWDFQGQYFDKHSITALTPVDLYTAQALRADQPSALTGLIWQWAEDTGPAYRSRTGSGSLAGWCSWYYYYTNINQENIRANLERIQKDRIPLELFQIDDGYQQAVGDWEPNAKFPEGMAALVRSIKKAGLKPGLWFAPFLAEKKSSVFQGAFLLRDQAGQPVRALYNPNWSGNTFALDTTHPACKIWLTDVVEMMVHEWGFEYLKLDFLYAACFRGNHHDPRTTGYMRLRDALKIIRKAAGKKVQLVGCGSPLFPAAGLVDIMRIGMDVHHSWNGTLLGTLLRDRNFPQMRNALVNTIQRSFFHRQFWMNDPDCLILRQKETRLTQAQIRLMASVMALSGGLILTSDDLNRLDQNDLMLWRQIVELSRLCADHRPWPLDRIPRDFPRTLWNPAGFLGLWNPTARAEWLEINPPRPANNLKDYWTGLPLPAKSDGKLRILLGPFESFVARF